MGTKIPQPCPSRQPPPTSAISAQPPPPPPPRKMAEAMARAAIKCRCMDCDRVWPLVHASRRLSMFCDLIRHERCPGCGVGAERIHLC